MSKRGRPLWIWICLLLLAGSFSHLPIWAAGKPPAAGDGYIRRVRTFETTSLAYNIPVGCVLARRKCALRKRSFAGRPNAHHDHNSAQPCGGHRRC